MPTIASPRRIENFEPRRQHPGSGESPHAGIRLRVAVATHRGALTQQLAAGVDPTSTPELVLRASQLTSERWRRQVARTLRHTLTDARRPALSRAPLSIVDRHAVLEASDAVQAAITRLAGPDPVSPKGMAMLERLLTDAISSPLYSPAEPATLRRQLLLAKTELDPPSAAVPYAA